jgi:hypothetical protein
MLWVKIKQGRGMERAETGGKIFNGVVGEGDI